MNKFSAKTLKELIDAYLKQVDITNQVDYLDKKTVKANNKAVNTMYEIVELINRKFGSEGVNEFSSLLEQRENSAYLWAAPHILERMAITETTKAKALQIIKEIATSDHPSALGFQGWLVNWENKKA